MEGGVEEFSGLGCGFMIRKSRTGNKAGKAAFITSGPDFDFMKEKFDWLRATLAVTIDSATQTW